MLLNVSLLKMLRYQDFLFLFFYKLLIDYKNNMNQNVKELMTGTLPPQTPAVLLKTSITEYKINLRLQYYCLRRVLIGFDAIARQHNSIPVIPCLFSLLALTGSTLSMPFKKAA